MMKELISLCSDVNISILYRVLAVIEGICRVIETVPDNAIVSIRRIFHCRLDMLSFISLMTWTSF